MQLVNDVDTKKIIILPKKRAIRKNIKIGMANEKIEDEWFQLKKQKEIILKLYSHNDPNEAIASNFFKEVGGEKSMALMIRRNFVKKITGYFSQDKKKKIADRENLITLEQTIEKIIAAHFKCHYCMKRVCFIYKHVREPEQWTLDRIDNNECHSNKNTVLCCLKCNLQKRLTNDKKFLFTKQMILVKK